MGKFYKTSNITTYLPLPHLFHFFFVSFSSFVALRSRQFALIWLARMCLLQD